MDKEQIKGAAKKAEGKIQEKVGEVTNDKSTELKGEAKQVEGEARKKAGDVKDALSG